VKSVDSAGLPEDRESRSFCLNGKERCMSQEKISIGLTGVRIEGSTSTLFVLLLVAALVVGAFATGKASALFDVCFGLR
jgi:hypothetical protein